LKNDVVRVLLFTIHKVVLLLPLSLELDEVEGGCGIGRVNPVINCNLMAILQVSVDLAVLVNNNRVAQK
jgi:hypothetical protein